MKASESIPNFRSGLRMYANFAARTIKKVCQEIGPREAGTQAELDAQNLMASLVGDAADEVKQEEFTISHRAFLGWLRLAGIFMFIALAAGIVNAFIPTVFFAPYIALVCCVLTAVMIFGEFLFYKPVIDPFFKKLTSHNTYCIRKASGETKRRIIIGGHMDTAYEWRYTYLGGSKMVTLVIVSAVLGLLITLGFSIAGFFVDNRTAEIVMLVVQALTIPALIAVMFFVNWKLPVDGAADDLTGVFTAMAALLYFKHNDIRLENTEIVAMSVGAEEEGLRGSKAFAKAHADEYKNDGVETFFLALDTLRDYEFMSVITKDMTGTVSLDKQACALVKKAAENADIPVKLSTIPLGSTDAAATQQGGIKSVAFTSMDPAPARYYHTRDDNVSVLEMKTLEDSLKVVLETIYLFDEQGLKDSY